MATSVEHVVVDAGGFIRNAPIREIGEEVYSLPDVVNEISDKATRQRLQVLPYKLNLKNPTAEAIVFVSDFAKKTGDYRHLSKPDISVLALTYMLEKQYSGEEHIRKEPLNKPAEYIVPSKTNAVQQVAGFYLDSKAQATDTENSDTPEPSKATAVETSDVLPENLLEEEEDKEAEEEGMEEEMDNNGDDDEGWITPSNISNVKRQMGMGSAEAEKTRVPVACLTTDFAMQNVLIQMGLNVVSVDGMLIKQARSYVLRCFACMKITYNMMKVFCPNCGNKTLKRVAMTRDGEGKVRYFFSRRPLNIRGMKYPLPQPKGGKHTNNPVLFEDQPIPQQRPRKSKQTDVFDPDYVASSSPFAIHDLSSRAATIGISGKHDFRNSAYWNKRNPNEPRRRHGRKK
ncbi:RNA-binding protein NOB1-like isoform X2 [Babylonia areolata]|uniref:RNA-binding protein NOB1-like isoform X2 n=1 Tax=Babylonia areolata TaxID=304850 RepID=UPI003FD4C7BB